MVVSKQIVENTMPIEEVLRFPYEMRKDFSVSERVAIEEAIRADIVRWHRSPRPRA